jgi:tetratricopeptide (TPR) repeat protein
VKAWTGLEAGALRRALRLSVRAYAEHLGVAVRTVSKWEQLGAGVRLRPDTQAILDTALERSSPSGQLRFRAILADTVPPARAVTAGYQRSESWDHETWEDDLDRAAVLLSRQAFPAATRLISRWLTRCQPGLPGQRESYLYGRSLMLLGDARRDQGTLSGPQSALASYREAHHVFTDLGIPRRAAQAELSLAVVAEMSGGLHQAARSYQCLAADQRLSRRDQARALLWVGTALGKDAEHAAAAHAMTRAARQFEELGEGDDWLIAQQKLALSYRGMGDLARAWHYIDLAASGGMSDTPLQRVRIDTARAHILISDAVGTRVGLSLLDQAALTASASGLGHQVRSIQAIRRAAVSTGPPSS